MRRSTHNSVAPALFLAALFVLPLGIGPWREERTASDDALYVYLPLILRLTPQTPPPNHAPLTPDDPFPADGSTGRVTPIILRWAGGDPDGDAVTYDVHFEANNSAPDDVLCNDAATITCDTGALADDTVYYWQVVATDEHGATTAGPVWAFTTNAPPSAPSNPSPVDGAADQNVDANLNWSSDDPDGDAITYDVHFAAGDSTPDAILCAGITTASCDPGALSYGTTYYWQVIARDEHGATTDGPIWAFTTGTEPNSDPHTPSNPDPPAGAMGEPVDVQFGWTGGDPDDDAVTYDVYFAAGDSTPDALLCDDISTTTCGSGALANGTHYYWQVVATDEHGATTAGPVWDFTTNAPPSTPANPVPADGATGQSIDVDLDWSGGDPDGDRVTHDVYFAANDSTPDALLCDDVRTTSCDPGDLGDDTIYYWQVVATDEHGATTAGPIWAFTTNAPPHPLSSPSPADGATGQSISVGLNWDGGDPDGDAVTYDVYFEAYDSTPNALLCDDVATPSCDPGTLSYGTRYYWQVVATDEHGATMTGAVWDFTTNSPPDSPYSPSPPDGDTGESINADLDWSGGDPDGDSITYDVYFEADNSAPDDLLCNDATTTTCDPGALVDDTIYYWQVVATDEHGATTAGPVWAFTTNAPPHAPSSPSPADGATGERINVDLDWSGGDPDGDSITYDVYFEANNSAPGDLLCNDATTTTCDPGALVDDTIYYWQVVATDEHGATTAGPVWAFTTNAPPHAPSSPSPADEAKDQDDAITVSWSGGDPDGHSVTYDVYLEANEASPGLLACPNVTVASCDPGPLSWGTHYSWQVVATDEHGATTTGPVWEFWTLSPPQEPTELTLSFDGYNGPYAIITGEWQDNAQNEAGFEIHYRPRDAGGGDTEVAYLGANETVFTLDSYHQCDDSGSGGYEAEWWIVAYNDAGTSSADYASVTVPVCQ